jgi:hypothetical protein
MSDEDGGDDDDGEDDLFDYAESVRLRDEGMKRVADNNPKFSYQYFHHVLALPLGWIGNNETIMKEWKGVEPRHPNAWGSNLGHCKRKGLLRELPMKRPNERKPGHARRQCLYMRVAPSSPDGVPTEPTSPIPGQSGVAGSEPVAAFEERHYVE